MKAFFAEYLFNFNESVTISGIVENYFGKSAIFFTYSNPDNPSDLPYLVKFSKNIWLIYLFKQSSSKLP
jgi:hypothetical protein